MAADSRLASDCHYHAQAVAYSTVHSVAAALTAWPTCGCIQKACLHRSQFLLWPICCQAELTRQRSTVLVADDGGQAVGWAVGWQVPEELHLMNVSGQCCPPTFLLISSATADLENAAPFETLLCLLLGVSSGRHSPASLLTQPFQPALPPTPGPIRWLCTHHTDGEATHVHCCTPL